MKNTSTPPIPTLAASITKAASKQTYYTIRFLADRDRAADAFRAYAYFRWVDDILDADTGSRSERIAFFNRQQVLLERGYRGEPEGELCPEEEMLLEMIKGDYETTSGLQSYLRNMMAVMGFDAERRGKFVSQADLDEYTHWLAVAVTEALHHFIGHDGFSLQDEFRYQAVTGAHITHMLRDALEDAETGYYNLPSELATARGITPWDVKSKAFRDYVKERVHAARLCFKTGRDYIARVENLRCRIAGYAYIRRFEIVLDCIEREGCLLRAYYPERKTCRRKIEMFTWALWMAFNHRKPASMASALSIR